MEQNLWLAAHCFSFWYWKLGGTVKENHPVCFIAFQSYHNEKIIPVFSIWLVLTYFNVWYIFNIKAKTFLQNHDFPAKTTWMVSKDCGKVDVVRTSGCCCCWQLTANVTSCSDTEPPAVIHQHSWTVSNLLKFTQRRNWGVILVKKTFFKKFSWKMLWYWKFLSVTLLGSGL